MIRPALSLLGPQSHANLGKQIRTGQSCRSRVRLPRKLGSLKKINPVEWTSEVKLTTPNQILKALQEGKDVPGKPGYFS